MKKRAARVSLLALLVILSVFAGPTRVGVAEGNVEQRIADFWKRVDGLQPNDYLSAGDLGQWALNVIERNPRARTTVADFRVSTAGMQGGMDRAGLAPSAPAGTTAPGATVEQRIADFWKRVDALQSSDHLSAADLGQWALNVIDRNPRARTTVADFRASTAGMQGALDRAGLAPAAPSPTPGPSVTPAPSGSLTPSPTPTSSVSPSATRVPSTLTLAPPSATVASGASQQFTASLRDQFAAPLAATVTWSLAPANLGTISPAGLFTAGQTGGTGIVAAIAQGLSATATITVQGPGTTTLGGIGFRVTTMAGADLYTETTISTADVQRLASQLTADITQIQTDYAQPFVTRPAAYVLASSTTFAQAVQTIGNAATPPPSWASGLCCFGPSRNWVFTDWQAQSTRVQITTMRHELTHAMEQQLAPQVALPAWFNEGNARLEEFTVPGTLSYAMVSRTRAASMAANGVLFTLADLTAQATWNGRSDLQAANEYAVAAQAVQLLRNDIGLGGELGMFRAMAQGQTFEAAYASVAGRSFSAFSSTYAARILALSPSYPAVASAPDALAGAGVSFAFYGLPSNTPFTLSISGDNGYRLSGDNSRTADAYGVYSSTLTTASNWPTGTYTISATWSGGTVSTSVAKATSLTAADVAGADSGVEVISGYR